MKARQLALLFGAALVAALVILGFSLGANDARLASRSVAPAPEAKPVVNSRPLAPSPPPPAPTAAAVATTAAGKEPPRADPKVIAAFLAAFRTPIVFYGRVVDQHGEAVPGAEVKFYVNDGKLQSSHQERRRSDEGGCFSLEGVRGAFLGVEVSKAGYHRLPSHDHKVIASSGDFAYAAGMNPHQPDKDHPVIFHLQKAGVLEPLEKIAEKRVLLPRDGAPILISLDPQDAHQVSVRCWSDDMKRPAGEARFNWRFEITVPDGDLILRPDELAFITPTDGYVPGDAIEASASDPWGGGWKSDAIRSYFFRFADGIYARADLKVEPAHGHYLNWASFLNPKSGSTSLEVEPASYGR